MAEGSSRRSTRATLVGAGLAGLASIVVLTGLTVLGFGPPALRAVVAVILGVAVAQIYERTRT